MVKPMKRTDTWTPLGTLTAAIACRLARGQAELQESPAARRPKPTSGGSDLCGKGSNARVAPVAGEDRDNIRQRNEVGAAPQGGDERPPSGALRGNDTDTGNVIDFREQPLLLAAWSGGRPRHSHGRRSFKSRSYKPAKDAADKSSAKAKSASDAPNRTATTPK